MFRKGLSFWILFISVATVFTVGDMRVKRVNKPVFAISYSYGSSGETVGRIQERLTHKGYYKAKADGEYGKSTYDAVRFFQKNSGIVAHGVADETTMIALGMFWEFQSLEEDVNLLAQYIHDEAGGETFEAQSAVGAVILNRVESDSFPDEIGEVVSQRVFYPDRGRVSERAKLAAFDALNGNDPTKGALYYRNTLKSTGAMRGNLNEGVSIGSYVFSN